MEDRVLETSLRFIDGPIRRIATDAAELSGKARWTIWRGPLAGIGSEGDLILDRRLDHLSELDSRRLCILSVMESSEHRITGEERRRRVVSNAAVPLSPSWLLRGIASESYLVAPADWPRAGRLSASHIYLDGAVMRDPSGEPYVAFINVRDSRGTLGLGWEHLREACYAKTDFSCVVHP